jgi:hypothetical protein
VKAKVRDAMADTLDRLPDMLARDGSRKSALVHHFRQSAWRCIWSCTNNLLTQYTIENILPWPPRPRRRSGGGWSSSHHGKEEN